MFIHSIVQKTMHGSYISNQTKTKNWKHRSIVGFSEHTYFPKINFCLKIHNVYFGNGLQFLAKLLKEPNELGCSLKLRTILRKNVILKLIRLKQPFENGKNSISFIRYQLPFLDSSSHQV